MSWNKYDFIRDLKDTIRDECFPNATYDQIEDVIREEVDRECIYTSDCWEIAAELSDFNPADIAYDALYEYAFEKIDIQELIDESQEPEYDEDDEYDESLQNRKFRRRK